MVNQLTDGQRIGRFLTQRYIAALLLVACLIVANALFIAYGTRQRDHVRVMEHLSDDQSFLLSSITERIDRLVEAPIGQRAAIATEINRLASTVAENDRKIVALAIDYDNQFFTPHILLAPIYLGENGISKRIAALQQAAKRIAAAPDFFNRYDQDYQRLTSTELAPTYDLLEEANDKQFEALAEMVRRMSNAEHFSHLAILVSLVLEALFLFRPMVRDVVAAHRRLEEYNRLKSEFIASISHEIRTPMNGIFGVAELLQESQLDDKQQAHLRALMNAADGLLLLIDDILDLSRLDAGTVSIDPLAFDLSLAIEDVAQMMAAQAVTKPLEVIVRYQPGLPKMVVGDPGRVRQILCNLVGNALKFTEAGYVSIVVEGDSDNPREPFRIVIEDTGIGIPADRLRNIFETFSPVDGSSSRKEGGLGIGLPIARRLTELMGGRIEVESRVGTGSRFTLVIPFGIAEAPPKSEAALEALAGERLLIVDDLELNRKLLSEQLTPLVAECATASSAEEAIRMMREARRQNRPYRIVVHDFLMPGMNGEEMARLVKSDPGLRDTVLVLLTSAGDSGFAQRFAACGVAAYLAKPVRPSLLAETLSLALERRGQTNASLITVHTTQALAAARLAARPHILKDSRILLVEDNRVNLQFTAELLGQMGCKVTTAENGLIAVERAQEQDFDLILMDCQMPLMDGFEATRQIRRLASRHELADVPIVALTANAMTGDRERCLKAGMNDYLTKPVRRVSLEAMLSRWVKQRDLEEWEAAMAAGTPPVSYDHSLYPTAFDETGETAMPTDAAALPAIDRSLLEETRELMEDKLPTLLSYYLEDGHEYLKQIRKGIAERDAKTIAAAAHTLKSSSRQFGILQVGEIAAQIEQEARLALGESELPAIIERLADPAAAAFDEAEALLGSYLQEIKAA